MDVNGVFIIIIRLFAFMFLLLAFSGSYRQTKFADKKYHAGTKSFDGQAGLRQPRRGGIFVGPATKNP